MSDSITIAYTHRHNSNLNADSHTSVLRNSLGRIRRGDCTGFARGLDHFRHRLSS